MTNDQNLKCRLINLMWIFADATFLKAKAFTRNCFEIALRVEIEGQFSITDHGGTKSLCFCELSFKDKNNLSS